MDTIAHSRVHSWWDGRVLIDELKEYKDTRGMLCELWRCDDEISKDVKPVMSYWSETDPYVLRGPHEHVSQFDNFVTWRSRMLYILHDTQTNETKSFITDPTKITRVIVAPTVVHCYRNLEPTMSLTGNFPSSLFMGTDKKEITDEIRHEEGLSGKKVYVILGASGRLGAAVTKMFLDAMHFYNYEVIPLNHKMKDSVDICNMLDGIDKATKLTKASDVTIINCMGVTDVQAVTKKNTNVYWANSDMPYLLGEYTGKKGFKFIHFSSDYVFQEIKPTISEEVSPYTASKKVYEEMLNESLNSGSESNKHVKVLRVANLFTSDVEDKNSIIYKLSSNINRFGEVKHDPIMRIGPTHVKTIAEWVFANRNSLDTLSTYTNLVPPETYTIKDVLDEFYRKYAKHVEKSSIYLPWYEKFYYSDNSVKLSSSVEYIKQLIESIEQIPH